ncbi:hypothetical protein J3U57_04020 [Gilliamella sp. B3464]|nr:MULTISPECIES: hypothetical protein [Gilliamella]MCX8711690.1 hypothetical protein [Gilliamella sp. B3468]MCX8727821.1 hypothetical protein [Gilliamella sp. B2838]MCX8739930.1 hypothetical protein [Gilliamella sp. B2824]MCX8750740.1 hypothetical protein [Gilliamella sp. B3464]
MINRDFINIKTKNRFDKDYQLTKHEIRFIYFANLILIFMGLVALLIAFY